MRESVRGLCVCERERGLCVSEVRAGFVPRVLTSTSDAFFTCSFHTPATACTRRELISSARSDGSTGLRATIERDSNV